LRNEIRRLYSLILFGSPCGFVTYLISSSGFPGYTVKTSILSKSPLAFAGSHTRPRYRLHSKRTYIQSRINELIDLKVIEKKGSAKAEKNKEVEIPLYTFTQFGKILAWLLEAKYSANSTSIRSNAIEMFFKELSSYVNTSCGASSFVDLFTNFFKQCIEKGVHDSIDNDYLEMFINLLPTDTSLLPQHFLLFLRQFLFAGLYK
jgi:hypothetical protein